MDGNFLYVCCKNIWELVMEMFVTADEVDVSYLSIVEEKFTREKLCSRISGRGITLQTIVGRIFVVEKWDEIIFRYISITVP